MSKKQRTVLELVQLASGYLAEKGVDSPRLDAEVLMGHVLGVDRVGIYVNFDRPLSTAEVDQYRRVIAERGRRVPVAQITGTKEFFSLPFAVTKDVLTPRPETELLVETALEAVRAEGEAPALRILDLGTGSGVLAITLAKELPHARVWATDRSEAALAVATENAAHHEVGDRVHFAQGEWVEPVANAGPFDLVVSNPPYIPSEVIPTLAPEVRNHEPRLALDGGADGLAPYRELLPAAYRVTVPGGSVAVEIGDGQAEDVARIGVAAGLQLIAQREDLAGKVRVLLFRRPEGSEGA